MNDSTWTWISGNTTTNQPGVYGEKGIPSPTNHPGARYEAVVWYDNLRQVFWLFGGYGYGDISILGSCRQYLSQLILPKHSADNRTGHLNDLWRYEVNNNTWTWMGGSTTTNKAGVYGVKGNASIENVPGSRRGAFGWYDSLRQEFWLFGGFGYSINISGM